MAGKYGSSSASVTYEDGPGGTARNISQFLLNGISVKKLSSMTSTTALGDSATEETPIGMTSGEVATLEGIWDTTGTTGTHAVFTAVDDGPQDDTREMVVVFGDSKTATIQTRLASYEVLASVDDITKFRAEVVVTGAVVWS